MKNECADRWKHEIVKSSEASSYDWNTVMQPSFQEQGACEDTRDACYTEHFFEQDSA